MADPNDTSTPRDLNADKNNPQQQDPRKQVQPGEVAPEVPPSPGMDNPVRQPTAPAPAPTPAPEQK